MTEVLSKEKCESVYKPDRAGDGICEHVQAHALWLMLATFLVMLVMFLDLQYVYPHVRNPLERWLAEGVIHVGWGLIAMNWALWFLQFITNGNLMKRSLQHAIASALVLSVYLLCVAYLIASV